MIFRSNFWYVATFVLANHLIVVTPGLFTYVHTCMNMLTLFTSMRKQRHRHTHIHTLFTRMHTHTHTYTHTNTETLITELVYNDTWWMFWFVHIIGFLVFWKITYMFYKWIKYIDWCIIETVSAKPSMLASKLWPTVFSMFEIS